MERIFIGILEKIKNKNLVAEVALFGGKWVKNSLLFSQTVLTMNISQQEWHDTYKLTCQSCTLQTLSNDLIFKKINHYKQKHVFFSLTDT